MWSEVIDPLIEGYDKSIELLKKELEDIVNNGEEMEQHRANKLHGYILKIENKKYSFQIDVVEYSLGEEIYEQGVKAFNELQSNAEKEKEKCFGLVGLMGF